MKNLSLTVQADLNLIKKETPTQRILEVCISAPPAEGNTTRTGLNLALVLDRSGSMSGHKLEYAKMAADHVLSLLGKIDQAALVAFDDDVLSLSPSVPVTGEGRAHLRSLLRRVEPGGGTNLAGGWLQGCQFAAEAAAKDAVNRALLLTDGLANVGIVDIEELGMHARQIHNRGISTSTFGVGEGFNEHLLELMANQGGGNFYYIETPQQIPEIFARELKELAAITARNVEIEFELPPHVGVQLPGGWKQEQEGSRLRAWLGDLASGQQREIYLQLLTPPSSEPTSIEIKITVRAVGEMETVFEEKAVLTLRYASAVEIAAATPDRPLMSRFSEVEVAAAANEALKLERRGMAREARHTLMERVAMAAPYLSEEKAEEYRKLAEGFERGLDEGDRKASQYSSYLNRQRRSR